MGLNEENIARKRNNILYCKKEKMEKRKKKAIYMD